VKKNHTLLLFLYLIVQFSYAQEYKKFLPFKQHGLWGLIDSSRQVVIKPTYKDVKIIGELKYLEFDYKTLVDLSTGKEIPSAGSFTQEVKIANQTYQLFRGKKKSTLIDLKNKDTITLSLKYDEMSPISLVDSKSLTENEYIIGQLDYDNLILLKNNTKLPMAISGNFSEYDLLENSEKKAVGIVIKKGNKTMVYDHKLRLKKALVTKSKYDLLTKEELQLIATLFKEESLSLPCFRCDEIYDSSLYTEKHLALPEIFTVDAYNSVTYQNKTGNKVKVRRSILNGYFSINFYVQILKFEKSLLIVDKKYVKPGKILFPKGELD